MYSSTVGAIADDHEIDRDVMLDDDGGTISTWYGPRVSARTPFDASVGCGRRSERQDDTASPSQS